MNHLQSVKGKAQSAPMNNPIEMIGPPPGRREYNNYNSYNNFGNYNNNFSRGQQIERNRQNRNNNYKVFEGATNNIPN